MLMFLLRQDSSRLIEGSSSFQYTMFDLKIQTIKCRAEECDYIIANKILLNTYLIFDFCWLQVIDQYVRRILLAIVLLVYNNKPPCNQNLQSKLEINSLGIQSRKQNKLHNSPLDLTLPIIYSNSKLLLELSAIWFVPATKLLLVRKY